MRILLDSIHELSIAQP